MAFGGSRDRKELKKVTLIPEFAGSMRKGERKSVYIPELTEKS